MTTGKADAAAIASHEAQATAREGRQLARNSLWNLGGWAVTLVLNFVAAPITVRQLGVEAYGVLSLLLTVIAPLGVFDLGLGEATVKYMSEAFGRKAPAEAEAYFRSTLLFNLGIGLSGAAVLVALAPWLVGSLFNIPAEFQGLAQLALGVIGINWALSMVAQTYLGALTALQNYRVISLGNLIGQGGTLLVGIAVLLAGGNLLHLVISQCACLGLVTAGWWLVVRRGLPDFRLTPQWNRVAFRKTAGMGIWQTVNKVGGLFAFRAQYWLLGISLPVATVGYYNIGYQVVTLVYLIAYKVGQVMLPAVSHLQGQGREDAAARHTVRATWLCSLLGVSLITAVICLAHDFLRLWVGAAMAREASPTLQVLALHTAFSLAFAVPNFYLLGTGRSIWLAGMAFVQGAVTFGTAWLLLPEYGLIGAAWGVLTGTAVHITMLVLVWVRIMRVWLPGRVYFSAVFGPVVAAIPTVLACLWLRARIGSAFNWPELFIAGGLCTGITGLGILAVDGLLPGGRERRADLRELVALVVIKAGLMPDRVKAA